MMRKLPTTSFSLTAKLVFSGLFALVFLFFMAISPTKADATSTLRGGAWWGDDLGFLFFNCIDSVSGDQLDREGNLTPPGFSFHAPPCMYEVYSVVIKSNGNLDGKAWNYNKGFVSFSGTSTPPSVSPDPRNNCREQCDASNNCWSCFNEAEKKLYGWARVDATEEWIRLDSNFSAGDNKPPVQLETCAENPPIAANTNGEPTSVFLSPGDLFGVASSDLGDLFFNCKNEADSSACNNRNDYKVYVSTLTVGALSAPHFSYADACKGDSLGATLRWCVKSGQQKGYEIVVSKDTGVSSDFGSVPTAAQLSGPCHISAPFNETARSFPVHNYCSLSYNSNYYWWIRLYDEDGPTIWYQYFGNTNSDSDGNRDGNPKTFSTFKHRFPNPFFNVPENAKVAFDIELSATSSQYYTDAAPDTGQDCNDTNCAYVWSSNSIYAIFSSTSTATTSVKFFEPSSSTTVTLRIIDLQPVGEDLELYYCELTKKIESINYDLPIWREVKAR